MMIMGEVCTRACTFCNVATGKPSALDPFEATSVARAVERLGLAHVVITSVDLADGGAEHFAAVIRAIRETTPDTTIEVLTSDFLRKDGAEDTVVAAHPDVFNHNLETVQRLYAEVRPGARYFNFLRLFDRVKNWTHQCLLRVLSQSFFLKNFTTVAPKNHTKTGPPSIILMPR